MLYEVITLYYLDKEWVISNLNKIFPKDNIEYWEPAFTGYLFYSKNVYTHLYKLLAENGHYEKGVLINFKDDHATDRISYNFV